MLNSIKNYLQGSGKEVFKLTKFSDERFTVSRLINSVFRLINSVFRLFVEIARDIDYNYSNEIIVIIRS